MKIKEKKKWKTKNIPLFALLSFSVSLFFYIFMFSLCVTHRMSHRFYSKCGHKSFVKWKKKENKNQNQNRSSSTFRSEIDKRTIVDARTRDRKSKMHVTWMFQSIDVDLSFEIDLPNCVAFKLKFPSFSSSSSFLNV